MKEPSFRRYGFIIGKIRYRETSEETAIRELREETGLTGKPKAKNISGIRRGAGHCG